jgi:hypothetical protein
MAGIIRLYEWVQYKRYKFIEDIVKKYSCKESFHENVLNLRYFPFGTIYSDNTIQINFV